MNYTDFNHACEKIFSLNKFLPMPSDDQVKKLFDLTEIMLETNKKMNLTAITDTNAIILKHYVDSLTVCSVTDIPQESAVIDVGCGAGFPSLPLAIFRRDLQITSLDSTEKRINYVKSTAFALGLTNIKTISGRAEDCANMIEYREKFDTVTARAVAPLPVLSEICLPFVKPGGAFIAMKAAQGESEITEAKKAIEFCGGVLRSVHKIEITANGIDNEQRIIVDIEKVKKTPDKYPRRYSQISKNPL